MKEDSKEQIIEKKITKTICLHCIEGSFDPLKKGDNTVLQYKFMSLVRFQGDIINDIIGVTKPCKC